MTRRITGSVGKLAVDDGGSGPAVVFLHSLAVNSSQWAAQLEHVRKTRRAIGMDLRGHGRSDPPSDGQHRIDAQVPDLDAVADALGLERFALVGHSFGAGVARSVTVRVVDLLEPIEVDHGDTQRPALVPRAIELAAQLLGDHPPIPESGQMVARRFSEQRLLRREQPSLEIEDSRT